MTQCMLTSPHKASTHRPHTHFRDSSPFTEAQRTQPSPFDHRTPPLYGRTRLYGFMGLNNDISQKFPLFSPHHRHHTHSRDASPFTEVQRTQPSPLDHMTHPLYGRTRLYCSMGLNNDSSRKFPLFSPHHRPRTHSRDASPFTEVQRTQRSPLDHRTHPFMDGSGSTALWA